jgi:hypothetical protein
MANDLNSNSRHSNTDHTSESGYPKDNHMHNKPKKSRKKATIAIISLILIAASISLLKINKNTYTGPVPEKIRKSVSFPIYYPDQSKLPSGYVLNNSSFSSPSTEAALYTVKYNNNKKLIFTVQKKPSDAELANFNKRYIPIHRQVLTSIGTATEGTINNQTVVSLPADDDNAWIIISGPSDAYGTNNLAQALKSLKK